MKIGGNLESIDGSLVWCFDNPPSLPTKFQDRNDLYLGIGASSPGKKGDVHDIYGYSTYQLDSELTMATNGREIVKIPKSPVGGHVVQKLPEETAEEIEELDNEGQRECGGGMSHGNYGGKNKDKSGGNDKSKETKDKPKETKDKSGEKDKSKEHKDKSGEKDKSKETKDKSGEKDKSKEHKDKSGEKDKSKETKDKSGEKDKSKEHKDKSGEKDKSKETKDKSGEKDKSKEPKDKSKEHKDKSGENDKSKDKSGEKGKGGKGRHKSNENDRSHGSSEEEPSKDCGDLEMDWLPHNRCQCSCHHVRATEGEFQYDISDEHPLDFQLPLLGEVGQCSLENDANFFDACRCWC